MPELQHELFQWWVDLTQVLQARVPTCMIMAQARLVIEDARAHAGLSTPFLDYLEPTINRMWVSRWRHYFNIVPRHITCSYKVSYAKKAATAWRNLAQHLPSPRAPCISVWS